MTDAWILNKWLMFLVPIYEEFEKKKKNGLKVRRRYYCERVVKPEPKILAIIKLSLVLLELEMNMHS